MRSKGLPGLSLGRTGDGVLAIVGRSLTRRHATYIESVPTHVAVNRIEHIVRKNDAVKGQTS